MARFVRPLAALGAALAAARVVLAILTALGFGLTGLPQATDLFITLGQGGTARDWAWLATGTAILSVSAWFWARFAILTVRPRHGATDRALPDILAAAACAIVAGGVWHAAGGVPPAMMAAVGTADSGERPLRIAAALLLLAAALAFAAGRAASRRPTLRPALLGAMVTLASAVALAGLAAYGTDPVATAHAVPPAATVLLAASGMMCGFTLLLHAGRRTGAPILFAVFAVATALAVLRDRDMLADNHDVRVLPGASAVRPALEDAFLRFLGEPGDEPGGEAGAPVPVVLVATSGGGLAAGYWTATVLGDLADAAPDFARRIFAISGVSGGAVGATVFVAAQGTGCIQGVRACAQEALSEDFLGPLLGAALYPDLFQRFLPMPVFDDRQTALERALEARFRRVFGTDRLGASFLDLWPAEKPWPALMLNATSLSTGGRLIASNIVPADPQTDILARTGAALPASTAAANAARFPYISPLGVIRDAAGLRTDAVGDGGYFENLGATTVLDLLEALHEVADRRGRAVRFVVVQIVTDLDVGADGQATDPDGQGWLPHGLTGPAEILLRTRTARGATASAELARRVASLGGHYVPVRLRRSPTGPTAPLGWSLSAVARAVIDAQWTPACRERLLQIAEFSPAAAAPAPAANRMDVPAMWRAAACAGVR